MQITFLGAAQEVGRSCILIDGKSKTLLDCGTKLGRNEEFPLLDNKTVKKIDRIAISHAHLDHSGYLPSVFAGGNYKGKVVLTKPTRDLIQLLLADYLRINSSSAKPYNEHDVAKFLKSTEILEYGQLDSSRTIRLINAGHILGSAMVEVSDEKKVLYTGDINTRSSRLLDGADLTNLDAEILIMESTYGAKADEHLSAKDATNMFIASIQDTLSKNGKVLIPSFAIGRGQEILFILESYMRSGKLDKVPIFIDGMVKKALKIYRHNAIYLKDEVKKRILTSDDDPFKSPFYVLPKRKDRSDVFEMEKAIVVATSGMLNGGPILSYLKELAGDRKSKLILSGFQAEGTPGRALLEGATSLKTNREIISGIELQIDTAKLSAHSCHRELLSVVRAMPNLKKVFLVHGEHKKQTELKAGIDEMCSRGKRNIEVIIPKLGETFEV